MLQRQVVIKFRARHPVPRHPGGPCLAVAIVRRPLIALLILTMTVIALLDGPPTPRVQEVAEGLRKS